MRNIPYSCPSCGGSAYRVPKDGNDEQHVFCNNCGHDMGSFGQVKEDMKKKGQEILKDGVDKLRAEIAAMNRRLR